MSKAKTCTQDKRWIVRVNKPRRVLTVFLILTVLAGGVVLTGWSGVSSSVQKEGRNQNREVSIESFAAGSPSKEYIYAGGRLLATEECGYSILPTGTCVIGGSTGNVSLTTSSWCTWTASANATWLHITSPPNGTGSGTVSYSVDQGSLDFPRQATLTIAGKTFTVVQGVDACVVGIAPTQIPTLPVGGGSGSLTITAGTRCGWAASTTASWLDITSCCGIANGTVTYYGAPNPTGLGRQATVTIEGTSGPQTVIIKQKAS